jgi:hypothetical protein
MAPMLSIESMPDTVDFMPSETMSSRRSGVMT